MLMLGRVGQGLVYFSHILPYVYECLEDFGEGTEGLSDALQDQLVLDPVLVVMGSSLPGSLEF